jgi:hypothetical protein
VIIVTARNIEVVDDREISVEHEAQFLVVSRLLAATAVYSAVFLSILSPAAPSS